MAKINTDKEKIQELMNRGTIVQVLPKKSDFVKKLQNGEKLRFYIGFDATAPTLHLSHAKNPGEFAVRLLNPIKLNSPT